MSALHAIQRQILEVDEMIARLNASASQHPRPSLLAEIRSLKKEQSKLRSEFQAAASTEELDVCFYTIDYPERPTIAGVSAALGGFQALFSELYISLKAASVSTAKKGTKPAAIETPQLGWGYEFAGSFGVAMTLPVRSGLWNDPVSEAAISAMFEIAGAGPGADLNRLTREFGAPAIAAMHRWTDIHAKNGYGVAVRWQSFSGSSRKFELKSGEMSSLRDRLAKTQIKTRLELAGTLVAVDTEEKSCRVKIDDGREIAATFDSAITEQDAARVPARYSVVLIETRSVVTGESGSASPEYFLTKLETLH